MTPLAYAYLADGLAAALSLALSRRSLSHRPISALLCAGLVCDAVARLCGPSPEGLRFAVALVAGQVYPWAVVGAVTRVLRARGWEGRPPGGADLHGAVRGRLACEAIPAVSPSGGRSVARKDEGPAGIRPSLARPGSSDEPNVVHRSRPRRVDDAARPMSILAPLAALFTLHASLLLASGLRGPALARVYAGTQAVVAVVLCGVVGRWERGRRRKDEGPEPLRDPSPKLPPVARLTGVQSGPLVPGDVAPYQERRPEHATLRPPTATEICAIVVAAAEVANAAGPYVGLPASWWLARVSYLSCYCALILTQGGALWTLRRSKPVTPDGPGSSS